MAARAATRAFANAAIRTKIASTLSITSHVSHRFRHASTFATCMQTSGNPFRPTTIQGIRYFSSEAPQQYRTLSFYKFSSIDRNSLKELREVLLKDLHALGIVGRIYIASEGINAQMSCPQQHLPQLKQYLHTKLEPIFGKLMDFNLGTEHSRSFRALHVRIRKQLVSDGMIEGTYDLSLQPSHLHPKDWHEKLEKARKSGKKPILIDMRNHYESQIGYFEGAIKPDVETFKGSMKAMNEIVKDLPKDQEVYMYCTG
jgi:UPF0176 protein